MTCASCEAYASNRLSGRYNTACPDCQIRHVATSPAHFRSMQLRQITAEYKAQLFARAGEDWQAMHGAVKALRSAQKALKQSTSHRGCSNGS